MFRKNGWAGHRAGPMKTAEAWKADTTDAAVCQYCNAGPTMMPLEMGDSCLHSLQKVFGSIPAFLGHQPPIPCLEVLRLVSGVGYVRLMS